MAERLHHDARIDALRQQERRARMPQIVKSDIGQVRGRQQRLELARHIPRFERRPERAGEHQPAILAALAGQRRASS